MASTVLPIAGGIGGFMLGGFRGAIIGANLGMAFGSKKKKAKSTASSSAQNVRLPTQEGPRLSDLRVQLSSYGEVIPKIYGTMRLVGNIIWTTDIKKRVNYSEEFVSPEQQQTTISYSYSVSLAISLCEGVVDEIIKIWADGKLLDAEALGTNQGRFNIHLGTSDQLPDSIIGRHKNPGTYPAYRDLCYVVIDDFALEQFDNRIPNFTFEVKRVVKFRPAVEDKIKEVILIPGAGEFVYADKIHDKQYGVANNNNFSILGQKHSINMHNFAGKANMLVALDQMAKTLPNLEWVGVVVTWFATASNAANCQIVPKVEFHCHDTRIVPNDWQVAGINRSQAEKVLYFDQYTPTYGGTPADETVIAICRQLKKCGYKVMLYPMIFVDEIVPNPKPWRGRIFAQSSREVENWFNGPKGYNNFIIHYANLCRNYFDAFIIGSELIGLTSFSERAGSFPAVEQLVNLAATVKQVVGSALVTYAADWSEYHHTDGGWFNLDLLWASPNIDFVEIDSYFPLTEDLPIAQITEANIKKGWESGEGWDYYWNWQRTEKHFFASDSPNTPYKYAWKNLEHWWNSTHQNPDGSTTPWRAKMKPVWFTEFGFPSVDACTNQPNVFYDPSSTESYFPRNSSGKVNFPAQRLALNATIDYLEERASKPGYSSLVAKKFVWTYDARPFPFWPDFRQVWQDGRLWATGHWINGKLGISNLGAVVADILHLIGMKPTDYDVSRLIGDVSGYIISQHISAREALEQLQSAYFFDSVESDGILKFMPRLCGASVASIVEAELVPSQSQDIKETLEINIAQELELPQKVSLTHIDQMQNYDLVTVQSQRQIVKTKDQINFSLPLIFSNQEAKQIADITLYNAWQERINYKLTLPPKYAYLEPTDIINVVCKGATHQIRIVKTDMQRLGQQQILATSFNVAMYEFPSQTSYLSPNYEVPKQIAGTILELIDAPPMVGSSRDQASIMLAAAADSDNWRGAAIYISTDDGYDYKLLTVINAEATMGIALGKLGAGSVFTFDNNEVTVQLLHGSLTSVSKLALLNGANYALIGDELIQFQNAQLISDNKYRLSKLLRGRQGTQSAVNSHAAGDKFILLKNPVVVSNVNNYLIGKTFLIKPVSIGRSLAETEAISFTFKARSLKPFAPVNLKANKDEVSNILISWVRCSRIDNDWRDNIELPINEESEKYQVELKIKGRLLRVLETTSPIAIYTKQDQDADFLDESVAKLDITAFQISAQVGRGYGANISISLN